MCEKENFPEWSMSLSIARHMIMETEHGNVLCTSTSWMRAYAKGSKYGALASVRNVLKYLDESMWRPAVSDSSENNPDG